MMLTIIPLQFASDVGSGQHFCKGDNFDFFLRKMMIVKNLAIVFAAAVVLVTKSSIGEVRREFGLVV